MSDSTDQDLARGLCAPQATFSPKYFYDQLGSKLFTAICELPEYYPTRVEAEILARHARDLALHLPARFTLVDLGAGDCRKAASLMPILQPARYVAVDISESFLSQAVASLAKEQPAIEMHALVRDFTTDWSLPPALADAPTVFFYPGSSIGNFSPDEAREFIARLGRLVAHENTWLMIGVDLIKAPAVLEAAYDDALGVTACFNRNALSNVNAVLGSDFRLADWAHRSVFNEDESRVEMHLVAQRALEVCWPGGKRAFRQGETIHTENAYKYQQSSFEALLDQAGFTTIASVTDEQSRFLVALARFSRG